MPQKCKMQHSAVEKKFLKKKNGGEVGVWGGLKGMNIQKVSWVSLSF